MPFTPIQTFVGGLLLHVSTSGLMTETGRVLGISGVTDGALLGDHARWRWAILAGLVSGPALVAAAGLAPALPPNGLELWAAAPAGRLALAGAMIGFGAKLGSGCTSGHFLCGASRLSPRSLVATATFMASAVAVAKLVPAGYLVDAVPAWAPSYPATAALPALGGLLLAAVLAHNALAALLPKACRPSTPPSEAESCYSPAQLLPYLLSGLTFSLGLIVSGMVSPLKVMGFLRLPPPLDAWDPSLAMIVVGGVIPNMIQWMALQTRTAGAPKPLFAWEKWHVPSRRDITPRLVLGALVFGAGWGLGGVCPGPAVVTGGQLAVDALRGVDVRAPLVGWASYIVNMGLGFVAARAVEARL
ncbi:hypothetical protein CC85DRAFT_273851 [Cutaneotrichosporon oleaginosum]|uniref:Sulphur transport domain-containing protein n=1 Tax=Cutaneotrichosporon oleaginosum TaxID=879819 RepID=A0A0J1B4S2_9TREE|nr:uncharacterized protein CC85DRAFT_273851 [Cutaneotrichosporon oleaginosum]KLT42679.1 hypothetical protein CC85DRAFT_273851 [Cutaneotrichosporon oleaginosum]TXT09600.1 hypothetical protein COLE_03534 [Cutaneotrichosporon oleaginosum]